MVHMKRTGWLVVNGFLTAEKYQNLYTMLKNAAEKRGVSLVCKRADELVCAVGEERAAFAPLPDFCVFWDKDVSLAQRLEDLGIPVFNGAEAVAVCDNKIRTAQKLTMHNVKTPKTIPAPMTFENVGYGDCAFLRAAEKELGYPMVIKEAYGSFGAQVYLAENRDGALAVIQKIGHKPFLMQEFIAESRGQDIRVNVVGNKVVCAMRRFNDNDFRSNVSAGGHTQSIRLTAEQEQIALAACRAIGLDFAGVDVLFGKDGPLVCEVNSSPHFKSSFDCTGVDLSEYVLAYILERV